VVLAGTAAVTAWRPSCSFSREIVNFMPGIVEGLLVPAV
jgi:hypothetical protein